MSNTESERTVTMMFVLSLTKSTVSIKINFDFVIACKSMCSVKH